MIGSCFFLLIIYPDITCFVISSFKSTQLKRCTNFERVSFLQSRNQVEISSHAKSVVEELSKKAGVIELITIHFVR